MKLLAKLTTVATIMSSVMSMTPMAHAATVTLASDTMNRMKAATISSHSIIFKTPTGVEASTDTITYTFGSGFTGAASIVAADVTIQESTDATCTAYAAAKSDANTAAAGVWGVGGAGQVVTLTPPTDAASGEIDATFCVKVVIGDGATGGLNDLTNPSAGANSVAIAGAFGDTGTIALSIVDDDQVTVTATVDPSITFDIDDSDTDAAPNSGGTNNATPYTVAFGTLTSADGKSSGATGVNYIYLDLDTNATGGAVVTVISANDGLDSTAVPADSIESATMTQANGTENYGICVRDGEVGSPTYNGGSQTVSLATATCAHDGDVNTVTGFTGALQTVYSVSSGVSGLRTQISLSANISGVTPAHADYTDTLTFVATATF